MSRPNFLLFITDQHRADHIGAYGNPVVKTPNIDALAANGWVAERCYVASPSCMPNRASLLTGRVPSVHRVRHNGIPLSFTETTFVERLSRNGYRTALVGKGHLQNISGKRPAWPRAADPKTDGEARRPEPGRFDQEWGPAWKADRNFDVNLPFYGFNDVCLVINHGDTAGGHYRRWLEDQHPEVADLTGRTHAIPSPEYALSYCGQAWRTRVPEGLSTTAYIGDQTCQLLDSYAAKDEPFFIQCSFPDPHHPFTPPGRFWDMYRPEDIDLPMSFHALSSGPVPHLEWVRAQRDAGTAVKNTPTMFAATERETREAIALNYGSISHIDSAIGGVLARLQELGLVENTVVIFTSDHGDFMGDHQLLLKGPLHYQGLIRVPLIWSDPTVNAGCSKELCSTIDIAPSILERAGCMPYNGIQGMSLLPSMLDPGFSGRDEILIETEHQRALFGLPYRTRMRTLQTSRYRFSIYEGAEWGELYDLENDPCECLNLWDDAKYVNLRNQLMHRLVKVMIKYSETSPNPTSQA